MKMVILKKKFGRFRIAFNKACTLAGIVKVVGNRVRIIVPPSIVDIENPYQLSLYGYAVVRFVDDEDWSLIDCDGNIIMKAPVIIQNSENLYGFGTFTVLLGDGNGSYAIYDPIQNLKSKCFYTKFEHCGSYIKAYRCGKVGAISLDFQEIIAPIHRNLEIFDSDTFKVEDEKTSRLYRQSKNCWSQPYYDFVKHPSFIEVIREGRGVIDIDDFTEILAPIYRKVEKFGTLYKGVLSNQSEVVMAKEWTTPSEECVKIYEEAYGFIRAIIQIKYSTKNLGYIFINRRNGKRLIDKVYDSAIDAKDNRGFIWAMKDSKICYINAQGQEVQNVAKIF